MLADPATSGLESLIPVIGILATVMLAVASSLGVWLVIRVGKSTTTLSEYKAAADSSQRRGDALEAELHDVKEQQTAERERARTAEDASQQEIAGLRAKVAILQEMVTGHTAIEHLTDLAKKNSDDIEKILKKLGNGQ
jgi:hypothetical protein